MAQGRIQRCEDGRWKRCPDGRLQSGCPVEPAECITGYVRFPFQLDLLAYGPLRDPVDSYRVRFVAPTAGVGDLFLGYGTLLMDDLDDLGTLDCAGESYSHVHNETLCPEGDATADGNLLFRWYTSTVHPISGEAVPEQLVAVSQRKRIWYYRGPLQYRDDFSDDNTCSESDFYPGGGFGPFPKCGFAAGILMLTGCQECTLLDPIPGTLECGQSSINCGVPGSEDEHCCCDEFGGSPCCSVIECPTEFTSVSPLELAVNDPANGVSHRLACDQADLELGECEDWYESGQGSFRVYLTFPLIDPITKAGLQAEEAFAYIVGSMPDRTWAGYFDAFSTLGTLTIGHYDTVVGGTKAAAASVFETEFPILDYLAETVTDPCGINPPDSDVSSSGGTEIIVGLNL